MEKHNHQPHKDDKKIDDEKDKKQDEKDKTVNQKIEESDKIKKKIGEIKDEEDEDDEDQDKPQRLKKRHGAGVGERGRSGRRESIFYRSSFGENDLSPLSISRKVSLASENLPEEQLITPFAQILQSLKYARQNFVLLSDHYLTAPHSPSNEKVLSKSPGNTELTDSETTKISSDTLEDLDWSIRQLERVHARRSVSDMTTFKFKKILSRELNQFSETGSSASEVSEFINNTFLNDKNKDFLETTSESEGVSGEVTSSSCSHMTLKQGGDLFPLPGKNKFRVFSKRKNSAPPFSNIREDLLLTVKKKSQKPHIARVDLNDPKFELLNSYWSKLCHEKMMSVNIEGGDGEKESDVDGGSSDGCLKEDSNRTNDDIVNDNKKNNKKSHNNNNNNININKTQINNNCYDEIVKENNNSNNKNENNNNKNENNNNNNNKSCVDRIVKDGGCGGLLELLKDVEDWSFDVFHFSELTNNSPLLFLTSYIFYKNHWLDVLNIEASTLLNFLNSVEHNYNNDNPYHNMLHSADVVQASYVLVGKSALKGLLSPMELIATVVAASVHDVDHPGLTNQFLVNSETDLALLYNDRSILENHHASVAFNILKQDDCNIFKNLPRGVYKVVRRMIIDMVLATDMSLHMKLVADLKTAIETEKVINVSKQRQRLQQLRQQQILLEQQDQQLLQPPLIQLQQQTTTISSQNNNNNESKGLLDLDNIEDTTQILQTLIHCADLGNPTRKLSLYQRWVQKIMHEFKQQGDMEKERGLDVSPMCGREVDVNKAQVCFIDYIVLPLWEAWDELMGKQCANALDNLSLNRDYYYRGDGGGGYGSDEDCSSDNDGDDCSD